MNVKKTKSSKKIVQKIAMSMTQSPILVYAPPMECKDMTMERLEQQGKNSRLYYALDERTYLLCQSRADINSCSPINIIVHVSKPDWNYISLCLIPHL